MTCKTAVLENTWLGISHGWGNGYVIIPENHPFYGIDYNVINRFVRVHGGLTYSKLCTEDSLNFFKLNHEDLNKWIIGFDTAHAGDNEVTWNKGAVQSEADNLLAQVLECAKLSKNDVLLKEEY